MVPLILASHLAASVITIDTTSRTAISPYIYGANFPDWTLGIPFTVVRMGGNRTTAYNWENNASNAGNDWQNQNDNYMGATNEAGKTYGDFMAVAFAHNSTALMTVQMAGHVAADKNPPGDVNLSGANYLDTRFKVSLAHKPGNAWVYPPSTTDANVYIDEFVHWMEGKRASDKQIWYCLDNEPDIWHATHSRIVLAQPSYEDFLARSIDYATMLKTVAPTALVFGPTSYGWAGYRTFQDAPGRNGRDFLDYYLASMKTASTSAGKRLLDVLDLHYYSEAQGGGNRVVGAGDNIDTQRARIQAPRSLWDTTYIENSWITSSLGNKPIQLLPDTFGRITANNPGTKLGFGEYGFGGENHISGAMAEADALGIFGRYGIHSAMHWIPSATTPAVNTGFKAFLNYDGKGGHFGNQGCAVSGAVAVDNSVYASLGAIKGQVVAVVINKKETAQTFTVRIPGWKPGLCSSYTWTQANLTAPTSARVMNARDGVQYTAPAWSVTTLDLRGTPDRVLTR